ncbi:MAG: PRC-barrel domain protein, partial [Pelosinus sp.]|nr:PRC-barrel domain protein [Pelosinus sp.]
KEIKEIKETEVAVNDDSARKFDEKNRKYLLGKKASRRIETDNGLLIVEEGGEITEEILQKAKLSGSFVELSMSIK